MVIQEERSIFLEVITSLTARKKTLHGAVSNSERLPRDCCLNLQTLKLYECNKGI